ncbi:MAG: UDP-N-acetylmuramoyl-tripeptide--D-alanyl-D-alanine ligase [Actinobacteria bacterium]|nr:UDP-N-acetylmuramoyl-tripeptide--D-alanyl-D-alanine ligase [Actinomycetota bacterium]
MRFKASQVATAVGGELVGDDCWLEGATQDSRAATPGCLFVPIVAERDGHDFIAAALDAGAAGYLTQNGPGPGTAIRVADTRAALLALGAAARGSLSGPVVGITGSVGKTSVKDLARAVLARRGPVHASHRSFNNEIGVPLTLLGADPDGPVIVELGARHVGDIAALCEVARPDIGVLTTVAVAHTGEFGSVGAVARTKGELFDALPPDGCAVLNADVPEVVAQASRARSRVLTFGEAGEVRARGVVLDDNLRASFRLESPWGRAEVRLSVHGAHMVPNALAAAAVGLVLDVPLADVAAGLAEGGASPWRMALGSAPSGLRVINDAYNANPASTAAALDALAALPVTGRRVAVLGLMAELGDRAADEHRAIAQRTADLGVELVAVGTDLYGIEPLADVDAAPAALDLGTDDAVLVKGSRVAGLEVLAERLLAG